VSFGGATVIKTGIWLPKRKWFSSEPYFAQWEELSKSSQGGALWIGSTKESKASVSLALRDVDNAVILERLLEILWKDGNYAKLRSGALFQSDPHDADDAEVNAGDDDDDEEICHTCRAEVTPTELGLCPYCGRRV